MALLFKDIDLHVQKWAFCAAWGLGRWKDRERFCRYGMNLELESDNLGEAKLVFPVI